MKDWKKEVARDILAIAGVPFFLVILARAFVGPYWNFVYQLSIAGVILLLFWMFFKKSNYYLSRGMVLWVFSSLFYQDANYTVFTLLVLLGLFGSLVYLKTKKAEMMNGFIVGAVVCFVTYYLTPLVPLLS
ncbi:hypothetical protein ACFLZZ_02400 [Nanoarchaeota archaeon]